MIIAHYSLTPRGLLSFHPHTKERAAETRQGTAWHLPPPLTIIYDKPVAPFQHLLLPSEEIVAGDAPPRNDITTNNSLPPQREAGSHHHAAKQAKPQRTLTQRRKAR